MLFSGQGVGTKVWISALVGPMGYHVPTPPGRWRCEMVDVLFGAGVGKALEFIIATSVSHVSGETWRGSVPLPRVPRCPRGRDRTRARRGSGCGKGEGPTGAWPAARLPTNRNPPDLKLGQKHDLKRTAGLEKFWACASSSGPWLPGTVRVSPARNSALKPRAGGLALLLARCCVSRSAYRSRVVCSWPFLSDQDSWRCVESVSPRLSKAVEFELGLSAASRTRVPQRSTSAAAPGLCGRSGALRGAERSSCGCLSPGSHWGSRAE